jgi:hypothetical protein
MGARRSDTPLFFLWCKINCTCSGQFRVIFWALHGEEYGEEDRSMWRFLEVFMTVAA